jgi:hypothetical protein
VSSLNLGAVSTSTLRILGAGPRAVARGCPGRTRTASDGAAPGGVPVAKMAPDGSSRRPGVLPQSQCSGLSRRPETRPPAQRGPVVADIPGAAGPCQTGALAAASTWPRRSHWQLELQLEPETPKPELAPAGRGTLFRGGGPRSRLSARGCWHGHGGKPTRGATRAVESAPVPGSWHLISDLRCDRPINRDVSTCGLCRDSEIHHWRKTEAPRCAGGGPKAQAT